MNHRRQEAIGHSPPTQRAASTGSLNGRAAAAASATSPRNPGGRPNGAERFAFKLDDGEGKVCMATRCHPSGGTVLLSLPAAVRSELLAATDERYHTAAIVGLAAWGLRELRRRKRNLTIIDADA